VSVSYAPGNRKPAAVVAQPARDSQTGRSAYSASVRR